MSTAICRIGVPEPSNTWTWSRAARDQVHVFEGSAGGGPLHLGVEVLGGGHHSPERHAVPGVGAPGHEGGEPGRVDVHLRIEVGVVIGAQGPPVLDRGIPVGPLGGVRAALQVGEGGLVRGDHAGLGAPFDGHVADRHAALHRQLFDGASPVLDDVALATARADLGDQRQDDILGGDPGRQVAVDVDGHHLRFLLRQRLGGEHVFHLRCADPEGQRPEGTVGRGVGVAADYGHAGLGHPELRADDVNDTLVAIAQRVKTDSELGRVPAQCFHLGSGDGIRDRFEDVQRGSVVILGRQGEIRTAHPPTVHPQTLEGLRARNLVHQV